jgi:hypothetical protein
MKLNVVGQLLVQPRMEAGISDRVWNLEEIVNLQA